MAIIRRSVTWLALLFCASLQTLNAQISIDFDADASGNPITAPAAFYLTGPLTTLYAPMGVTFGGGGAILSGSGSFGVLPLSGDNVLAFNPETYATGPETITFDTRMSSVSIFAGNAINGEQFTMQAYGGTGNSLVDSETVTASAGTWEQLNVDSSAGISSVVLSANGGAASWIYDNLSATPAPEPSFSAFSAAGFIGFLVYRRATRKNNK
jgi:hypothetical protein